MEAIVEAMGQALALSRSRITELSALGLSVCVASSVAWQQPPLTAILLVTIAAVLALTLIRALKTARHSPADPIWLSLGSFTIFFFLRPLSDYLNSSFRWVYIDVSDSADRALTAALVAMATYLIGTSLTAGRTIARRLPAPISGYRTDQLFVSAVALLFIGYALKLSSAILAGGPHTLLATRRQLQDDAINVPLITEGTLIVLPAFLLFWKLQEKTALPSRAGMVLCTLPLLQSIYSGNRRYALIFLISTGTFFFLKSRRSPSLLQATGALVLLYLFLIAPIEISRATGMPYKDSTIYAVNHPTTVADQLFLESQSTAMLNTFAILLQSSDQPVLQGYRRGLSTLTETLLQPIPRELWNSKPLPIRTLLIQANWGMERGACSNLCPTATALSTFYSDLGLLGVVLGVFAFAVGMRAAYQYWVRFPESFLSQAVLSVLAPAGIFFWWEGVSRFTLIVGTGVIPLVFCCWLSRYQSPFRLMSGVALNSNQTSTKRISDQ